MRLLLLCWLVSTLLSGCDSAPPEATAAPGLTLNAETRELALPVRHLFNATEVQNFRGTHGNNYLPLAQPFLDKARTATLVRDWQTALHAYKRALTFWPQDTLYLELLRAAVLARDEDVLGCMSGFASNFELDSHKGEAYFLLAKASCSGLITDRGTGTASRSESVSYLLGQAAETGYLRPEYRTDPAFRGSKNDPNVQSVFLRLGNPTEAQLRKRLADFLFEKAPKLEMASGIALRKQHITDYGNSGALNYLQEDARPRTEWETELYLGTFMELVPDDLKHRNENGQLENWLRFQSHKLLGTFRQGNARWLLVSAQLRHAIGLERELQGSEIWLLSYTPEGQPRQAKRIARLDGPDYQTADIVSGYLRIRSYRLLWQLPFNLERPSPDNTITGLELTETAHFRLAANGTLEPVAAEAAPPFAQQEPEPLTPATL
jgi:hypothetical protein